MLPKSAKTEKILKQAMDSKGFDQKYSVEQLIMNTTLYSVYLVSESEHPGAKDAVLLIEHLPANEPTAHLLPVQIRESASKTETIKKITDAVEHHFAQKDGSSS
ncbi:hypothetical protein [Metaplanococcus flavidus]|uniref:Uncharacterized protein n=1 Tax=Metaplanococcus flavidus TaxID=569883 RepID=A0ABW3LD29_9BACL